MQDSPLLSLAFGFWQNVATNLRNNDAKNLRLTCKKITQEVDASYLLNIALAIGNKKTSSKKNQPILFNYSFKCYVESKVRQIIFTARHRSDCAVIFSHTTFQPWIKAIERLKDSNITVYFNEGQKNKKLASFFLKDYLDSSAIHATVRDDDDMSVQPDPWTKYPESLVHVVGYPPRYTVFSKGYDSDFEFKLNGIALQTKVLKNGEVKKSVSLRMALPLSRKWTG